MKVKCTFLKNLSLIQICGLPGLSTDSGVQAGVVPEAVEPAGTSSHFPFARIQTQSQPNSRRVLWKYNPLSVKDKKYITFGNTQPCLCRKDKIFFSRKTYKIID
jgi:hypothetical protein